MGIQFDDEGTAFLRRDEKERYGGYWEHLEFRNNEVGFVSLCGEEVVGIGAAVAEGIKLLLWILGYFMKSASIKIEAKQAFYKYVKEMDKISLTPVRLKKDLDDIFKELDKEEDNA